MGPLLRGLLILEKDILNKYIKKLPALLQTAYALLLVLIGWVFFACDTLGEAIRYLGTMFGVGATGVFDASAGYALITNGFMLLLGIVAMLPFIRNRIKPCAEKNPLYLLVPCLVIFFLCVVYLADASYNPFLYFRF